MNFLSLVRIRPSLTSYGWTYGLSPETEGVLMQEDDASVRRSTYRLSEGLIANFINISMYSLIQASGTYPFQDEKFENMQVLKTF